MCDDKLVFPVWVNVYNCSQGYGGSEEGGWWYTEGVFEESHKVFTQEELEATQAILEARYELFEGRYLYEDQYDHPLFDRDRNSPYSATGTGFWFSIRIQDHAAKNFPEERPHYE